MYGIFLEEINHGVDGGLYAELIANRAFEDSRAPEGFTLQGGRYKDAKGYDSGFEVREGEVPHWSFVCERGAKGVVHLETSGGLSEHTPYCLRMEVDEPGSGRLGVANEGYWGIGLKKGERYDLVLHARSEGGFAGPVLARLENAAGVPSSDTVRFGGLGTAWKKFEGRLVARSSEAQARLVIWSVNKGRMWLDWVSLLPHQNWKGHGLRPDIAQMIADLNPGFVRWPGGCVVEGGTVETAYNWKMGVGQMEQRPECWTAWNCRRTHGIGLFEYLQFCEDLGAEPLYVGFAGQTCLFRETENVPMPEMGWVLTNFLDAIEYANGPPTSTWGARRAKAGHPAPFNLKLIEIGNENGTAEFPPRYRLIHEALKARFPAISYVADLSWIGRDLMKGCSFDLEDNHYYNSPQWFMANFDLYGQRSRDLPPVYCGEVAVTSGEGGDLKGNLFAALGEGVFLMGCERNADVVKMVSYAPLLAHVSGRSGWHGMIYHDSTRAFGTVSYYLWKLFAHNRPDFTVQTEVKFEKSTKPAIAGAVGVGTWDTAAEFKDIRVEKNGQLLYASYFPTVAKDWNTDGGKWSVVDGAWRQSEPVVGVSYFGDETWSDYTLTLKARKLNGAEGFLVLFGRKGGDQYWWNFGGWGNRDHAIEFNRSPVGRHARGQIETGRWYDIKIELAGERIRCYLDGKLIHEETGARTANFFAVAGREQSTGDLLLKIINTADEGFATTIKLTEAGRIGSEADVTELTSGRLDDNNSLEQPTKVVPVTRKAKIQGAEFTYEFPARSFTIIRLKCK
jgi:alpha-L-arabinofuranosidase